MRRVVDGRGPIADGSWAGTGSNRKAEKARDIAEAFEAFGRLLGGLRLESCVYVQDVRATAYGFGGRTQEFRHQHPEP
jgi:4-oxalocrotonate tautomerase